MDVGAEVFRQGCHPLDQRVFNRYCLSRFGRMLPARVLSFDNAWTRSASSAPDTLVRFDQKREAFFNRLNTHCLAARFQ